MIEQDREKAPARPMDDRGGTVLAKIIAHKFGFDPITSEAVAADLIRDDFPKNGIRTMGQALAYLDEVARLDRRAEQS